MIERAGWTTQSTLAHDGRRALGAQSGMARTKNQSLLTELSERIKTTFSTVPNVVATLLPERHNHALATEASQTMLTEPISLEEDNIVYHTMPKLTPNQIDFKTLTQFYQTFNGKSQTLTNALMFGLDALLERPRFLIRDIFGLKFVVILMLNPLLLHSASREEIFFHQRVMQRAYGFISNASFTTEMIDWMIESIPVGVFRKLADVTNFFITQRVLVPELGLSHANIYGDWAVEAALTFQQALVAANEMEGKILESEFYNSGLDTINLIYDFEGWVNSKEFGKKGHFYFCDFPFALSLACKMKIFNYESGKEQGILAEQAIVESLLFFEPINPFCVLKIRRDMIVHDSLLQISEQKHQLKKKLRVEFTDESGLDAGGLAKEWLLLLVRDLFNPIQGLFCSEEGGRFLWFCPTKDCPNKLEVFQLCGIIIGLAMYNGVLLDLPLPSLCYKKLLGKEGTLDDLKEFKPELYKNLKFILEYKNAADFEETFSLSFTYYDVDMEEKINLYPSSDGIISIDNDDVPVTFENRHLYVSQYVDYLLNGRIRAIFEEFKKGFLLVCSGHSLHLFKPFEIEALVNGSKEPSVNIALIRENSVYSNGFHPDDPLIKQFWEIFENYDEKHKRNLLRFVTGSDRLPCVGNPSDFGIHVSCLEDTDSDRYPTAHTCFNQLCLYRYSSRQKLYDKLTTAIDECTGFDLK